MTKSQARQAKIKVKKDKKKLAWKQLVEVTYEGNYGRFWRDETLRDLRGKIALLRSSILHLDYQISLDSNPDDIRKYMKKEKNILILEIDAFTLDIEFIKNDLAHIYRLKTKFQRDYTRPLPMHLFQ